MSLAERFGRQLRRDAEDPEFLLEWVIADLNEQILAAMEEQGMNRTELAERLGVSRQYVTKLLNGMPNLTLKTLVQIAASLGRRASITLPEAAPAEPPAQVRRRSSHTVVSNT